MLSGHKDVERERATERGNKYKRIMTTTTSAAAAAATRGEEEERTGRVSLLNICIKASKRLANINHT